MFVGAKLGGLNDFVSGPGKDISGFIVGSDQSAEIMQGLLTGVRLKRVNIKGILPPEIKFQRAQRLLISQVVHFFQNTKPD